MIIRLIDDVPDGPRAGDLQDKGVHPGDMVGHKKKPATRQIFQTERSDAIKRTNQQPTKEIEAALGPDIRASFFAAGDVNAMTKTGLLGDAFFVTYMISAPILGLLADRFSRWIIVGSAVILWSLASGGSGLAATFAILFATRVCVGVGEGGYGPAAPTILSDHYPIETRGRVMALFCAAIPVGSAIGFVVGGLIGAHLGWRWAFYLIAPPGV